MTHYTNGNHRQLTFSKRSSLITRSSLIFTSIVTMIVTTLVALVGCGSQPAQSSYSVPQRAYSQQCNITQSESYIWLEQEDEWLGLPEQARQQFEQEQIDWLKENVLIVSLGQKTTAGYNIELSQWLLEQDYWQVTRITSTPQAGKLNAMVMTSPCVMVKIPKSIKSFSLINPEGRVLGRWPY